MEGAENAEAPGQDMLCGSDEHSGLSRGCLKSRSKG